MPSSVSSCPALDTVAVSSDMADDRTATSPNGIRLNRNLKQKSYQKYQIWKHYLISKQ